MAQTQTADAAQLARVIRGSWVASSERWVRVKFEGIFVADSKRPLLLIQYGPRRLPTYYFPQSDVRLDLLATGSRVDESGEFVYWTLSTGSRVSENAAWTYARPPGEIARLQGHVAFDWDKMDAWYEEAEEVFVHARDPYKRVDVMASTRHVRIVLDGETIAETRRPSLLFETSLPTRYYIPREDVRTELLESSDLTTRCPYKGRASYWSVRVGGESVQEYGVELSRSNFGEPEDQGVVLLLQ